MKIEDSEGYKKLLAAVEQDASKGTDHDYRGKFDWAIARAHHYAEKTGLSAIDILNAWEKDRSYWYMNYYQDCKQPEIKDDNVRVFETIEDLRKSIGRAEYRCPACNGVSNSAYECNSGVEVKGKVCDWKSYGLFGTLGKGVTVYVKSELKGQQIFKPIAWEEQETPVPIPSQA